MHRRLAVPMLPLRVWVHCPMASNGLLPPRSYLVGYLRWHTGSDSVFSPSSFRQSFQQLSGRRRANLTLPTREGLPTTRPELTDIRPKCCAAYDYPHGNVLSGAPVPSAILLAFSARI